MKSKAIHLGVDDPYYHGEGVVERTLCGFYVKHYPDMLRVDVPEQVTCGRCKRWMKEGGIYDAGDSRSIETH